MRTWILVISTAVLIGLAGCQKEEKATGHTSPAQVTQQPKPTYTITPAARQPDAIQEPASAPAESSISAMSTQPITQPVPTPAPAAGQPHPTQPAPTPASVTPSTPPAPMTPADPEYGFLTDSAFPAFVRANFDRLQSMGNEASSSIMGSKYDWSYDAVHDCIAVAQGRRNLEYVKMRAATDESSAPKGRVESMSYRSGIRKVREYFEREKGKPVLKDPYRL